MSLATPGFQISLITDQKLYIFIQSSALRFRVVCDRERGLLAAVTLVFFFLRFSGAHVVFFQHGVERNQRYGERKETRVYSPNQTAYPSPCAGAPRRDNVQRKLSMKFIISGVHYNKRERESCVA